MPDQPLLIAVVLSDTTVQAIFWKTVGNQVEILNQSQVENYKDQASLVKATDEALRELGPESEEISQVIFGVPEAWIETEDIKIDKKPLLKKITTDLELKPHGYIVVEEALTFYLKNQEPQLSALLLGVSTDSLQLKLFKFGKLMSTQQVGRSDKIIADLIEALARLQHLDQIKSLPTKFHLYSLVLLPEELIELQQKLVKFDWTKDDTFFYQPIFEVVTPEILALSVATQAQSSLKGAVVVPAPAENASKSASSQSANDTEMDAVVTQDIDSADDATPETAEPVTTAKSFGIPISLTPPPQLESDEALETEVKQQDQELSKPKLVRLLLAHKVAVIGGFIAGLLALGLLTFVASRTLLQAQIEVLRESKTISKDVSFTLDPSATTSDPTQLILAAEMVKKEVVGTKTGATSGVKLIGDKAKGTVQLLNKTTAEKKFTAGTELSAGELVFVLDSDVTIASASVSSSSDSETKTFGKVETAVTAAEIGADSNISKDTKLVVAAFDTSSYEAVAQADFSGGASREVRVVAQQDQTNLEKELLQELAGQAEQAFAQEAPDGSYIVSTGESTVLDRSFDLKVGEEANNLTLNLSASFSGVKYAAGDLKPLAAAVLADQIPAGYVLSEQEPNIMSQPTESASTSAQVKLAAQITAKTVPQITEAELKQTVAGKSAQSAVQLLEEKPEIVSASIRFQPSWLGMLFAWIPAVEKITVVFK